MLSTNGQKLQADASVDELRTQLAKITGRVFTLNELADDIYDRLYGSPPRPVDPPSTGQAEDMPHVQLSLQRIGAQLDKLSTCLEAIRNQL